MTLRLLKIYEFQLLCNTIASLYEYIYRDEYLRTISFQA
jgi:hypothetical protein